MQQEFDMINELLIDKKARMTRQLQQELESILKSVTAKPVSLIFHHFSIVSKNRSKLSKLLDDEIFPKTELRVSPAFYGIALPSVSA